MDYVSFVMKKIRDGIVRTVSVIMIKSPKIKLELGMWFRKFITYFGYYAHCPDYHSPDVWISLRCGYCGKFKRYDKTN